MNFPEFLTFSQSHLSDGLVTIVGSGISAAEGIPGMPALASHLKAEIPGKVSGVTERSQWETVSKELDKGRDLEGALSSTTVSEDLESLVVKVAGEYIELAETEIVGQVVGNGRVLRLSKLFNFIPKVNTGIPVITTNYDRLIEVAAEISGFGVESLFSGNYVSPLHPDAGRMGFCKSVSIKGKNVRYFFKDRIILLKPHGSLDWYQRGTDPIRSSFPLNLPRLIITPGLNKYRSGYNRPFDIHREKANQYIDKATKLLVIGYGFNDDHLETHLKAKILGGTPTLIFARTLTSNCKKIVSLSPNAFAVERAGAGQSNVHSQRGIYSFDKDIWDLEVFLQEAFGA